MLVDYVKLLFILEEAGVVRSRKKFQKMVYLLQQKGMPFDEDFYLHYFGPYSSELQIEINRLAEGGLIRQWFENDAYVFKIEDKGSTFLEENKALIHALVELDLARLIKSLNKIPPHILEVMATIIYFEKSYGSNKKDELRRALSAIKGKLIGFFDQAWDLLDENGLHLSLKA
jgi:uncharacterized protein YwgA